MELTKDTAQNSFSGIDLKENLYRAVIQNALEGFVMLNLEGDILDVNEAFSQMIGYSRHELFTMKIYNIYPQKVTADRYAEYIKDRLRQGGANLESRHRCKDGRIIDVKVSFKYLDANGGIFFTFHSDITEEKRRKQQEERNLTRTCETLKDTEDRCHTLMELGSKIGEAIVMLQDMHDREGMHTYVSDQWPAFTGYSREELLAMSFFDLVKPEDKEASISRHRQKMSGKTLPHLVELTIIHKDGYEVFVELTSASTIYNKQPVNMMYIRDVTERKHLEKQISDDRERYKCLFEDAPTTIWEVDLSELKKYFSKLRGEGVTDFRKHFNESYKNVRIAQPYIKMKNGNKAALDLFEAKSMENYNINMKATLKPGSEHFELLKNLLIALGEGYTYFQKEEIIQTFKGKKKNVQFMYSIPSAFEDSWSMVFFSEIDITKLKQAEIQLNKYKEHLEELVDERTEQLKREVKHRSLAEKKLKALCASEQKLRNELETEMRNKVEFNRMLVHELNTPLLPILGTSEIMAKNLDIQPWKDMAQNVHHGARTLATRIEDLLDIERADAGMLKLNFQNVDLLQLIKTVHKCTLLQAAEEKQTICLEIPDSLPVVLGDYDRLQQILHNILNNAFKFTPYGGTIMLKARESLGYIIVEIQDTGPGISKKNQKIIFEPYRRLSRDNNYHGGLGIGLALCKKLVALHGGRIWVESRIGKGSSFLFSIPLKN